MQSVIYHFVENILSFKNTEAILNDFACTRGYSRCKGRRRHIGYARHWHLKG